ncbi:M16 family metallopeptidase [Archangium lansingense]|uniref:M16 family metallopeptidase n=1 Tax=Archangium lansingense TaxID=2995310 RepID=UPI003B75DBE8
MGTVRLLGLLLLPCLFMQGCATAPTTAARPVRFAARGLNPVAAAKVSTAVYPKGMRLVVREDPKAHEVSMYVSYRVGATDEPAGKAGLAELAARLTRMARHGGASAQTLEARLAAVDATTNNVVTHDDTELWVTLAPARFATVVGLEAQRMLDPLAHVTEEDFQRVRARQVDDLWARYERSDNGPAQRWLHEKLLEGHAYGRPVGGTPESLEKVTLEDVRAFVKANYTPAHAVLVVSSPLPLADTKFEVASAFAGLAGLGSEARIPPAERIPPPMPEDVPGGAPMQVVRGPVKVPRLHFVLTLPGRYSGMYAEEQVAMEAVQSWMRANLKRDEYPLGRSFSIHYQELDGVTVLDCFVDLMRNVREEEARKLVPSMLATLERHADQITQGMKDAEPGSSTKANLAANKTLRASLMQDLHRQSLMTSPMNIARVLRSTGRADMLRLREEQVNRVLTSEELSPYLRLYVRAERVRTLLILP